MQKMKRLFLALLTAVGMMLAAVSTCLAANVGDAELEMIRQEAEMVIEQIGSMDDASLGQTIAFAEQQDPVMAAGLKSWQALKAETGPFGKIESSEIKQTDDGFLVSAQISCGDRTATVHLGLDEGMTTMTQLSFDKNETMGEKFQNAAFNLIVGMGTVFLVLIFIAWIISQFKHINDWVTAKEKFEKEERDYQAAVAAAAKMPAVAKDVSKRITADMIRQAVVPEGATAERVYAPGEKEAEEAEKAALKPAGLDPQLIAVLAAAVAAAEGPDAQLVAVMTAAIQAFRGDDAGPDGLVVRSIKRVPKRKVRGAF